MTNKIRLAFVVSLLSVINTSAILMIALLDKSAAIVVATLLSGVCAILLMWIYANWK
jgi:hypothetical protein